MSRQSDPDDGGDVVWVFPDTHLFLHYKSMKDWDLASIVQGSPTVVATVELVRELDKTKYGKNRRLAKRAQAAQNLIKQVQAGRATLRFPIEIFNKDPGTAARDRGLDDTSADQRMLALVLDWKFTLTSAVGLQNLENKEKITRLLDALYKDLTNLISWMGSTAASPSAN